MASVREIDMVIQNLNTQKCCNKETNFRFEKGECAHARKSDVPEASSTGARNVRAERCLRNRLQLSTIAVQLEPMT